MFDCLFEVGDMVVCIDANEESSRHLVNAGQNTAGDLDGLTEGAIYTVRDLYVDERVYNNVVCVRLVEIIRGLSKADACEPGFWWKRFRPVKKTSIDCFKSARAPSKTAIEKYNQEWLTDA